MNNAIKLRCLLIFRDNWSLSEVNFKRRVKEVGISRPGLIEMYNLGMVKRIANGHIEAQI